MTYRVILCHLFFFFKQKTAYEITRRDWSSDVCSSDLSRTDTRTLTREWMLAHVPARSPIVVEPVSPDAWARETRPGASPAAGPYRWIKYPSLVSRVSATGALQSRTRLVSI